MSTKELISKYGDVFFSAKQIKEEQLNVIPIGPSLDLGVHGGIQEGNWVIISGPPKFGKTGLALQIAKNAQLLFNKKVFIGDAEGRFGQLSATSVNGLDIENLTVIKSSVGNILTAQKHLDIGLSVLRENPGCIYILDSSSALCADEELSAEIKSAGRNNTPKLLASFCRQAGQIVPVNKSIVIIITHLIANTSGYGSPYVEDSGQKIKYQFNYKIKAKSMEKWVKDDKQIGQIVKWVIEGSALGPPGNTAQSYIRYGYGIDETMEIIELALLTGLIKKGGAWFSSPLIEDRKFQGQENLHTFLSENIELRDKIYTEVKKIL